MPVIRREYEALSLTPTKSIEISKGESPKIFLTDGRDYYIYKQPKKRTFESIFKENFPSDLESYRTWTLDDYRTKRELISLIDKQKLEPYAIHLNDLLFEAAFGEVIYQLIAKNLFKSFEPTECFLHVDSDLGELGIISRFRSDFNEFIEHRLNATLDRKKSSVNEWELSLLPTRDDLHLSENENYLLGKLFALALITNDWDVVNNIMLSNAGCIGDSETATKIMVVDGGNKFQFGFDGLSCDETSFKNSELIETLGNDHPLKGYLNTLPFDKEVSLKLPRLLIPNLFQMTNPLLFRGLKEGMLEAKASLTENPYCIQQAVNQASNFFTLDCNSTTLKRFSDSNSGIICHSYYFPKANQPDNLEAIIKARCYSLQALCKRLEYGTTADELQAEVLEKYRQSQSPSCISKVDSSGTLFQAPDTPLSAYMPHPASVNSSFGGCPLTFNF